MFRAVLINYTATITITPLNCMVITRANLYETNSFRKNCREPSGVTQRFRGSFVLYHDIVQ